MFNSEDLQLELNNNNSVKNFLTSTNLKINEIKLVQFNHQNLLRVTISSTTGQPITIGNVAKTTRILDDVLQTSKSFSQDWLIEVTSAGVEQPINSFKELLEALGEYIHLRLINPIDNQTRFNGILKAVNSENQNITLEYKIKTRTCVLNTEYKNIKKVRHAVKF